MGLGEVSQFSTRGEKKEENQHLLPTSHISGNFLTYYFILSLTLWWYYYYFCFLGDGTETGVKGLLQSYKATKWWCWNKNQVLSVSKVISPNTKDLGSHGKRNENTEMHTIIVVTAA